MQGIRFAASMVVVSVICGSLSILVSGGIIPSYWEQETRSLDLEELLINETATLPTDYTPESVTVINGVLYCGDAHAQLYQSVDYGDTWVEVYNFTELGEPVDADIYLIWYSQNWATYFIGTYPTGNDTLYRSTDLSTWLVSDTVPSSGVIYTAGICDASTNEIYYSTWGSSTAPDYNSYIRVSDDGGVSWATETTVIAYHAHGVGETHDGLLMAGYGDVGSGPLTAGIYTRTGAVWANNTDWLVSQSAGTFILDMADCTLVGGHWGLFRYDGSTYTQCYSPGTTEAYILYDLLKIEDVAYAVIYRGGVPERSYFGASPDHGKTWVELMYCTSDDRVISIAGESGHPYIYYETAGGGLYRIANLGLSGAHEIQKGADSSYTPSSTFTSQFFIANENYTVPLGRNGIQNPVVTITAQSLTNLKNNGDFSGGYTSWSFTPSAMRKCLDTTNYTVGSQSLWIDIESTSTAITGSAITRPSGAGKYYAMQFDCRLGNGTSDYMLIGAFLRHATSGAVTITDSSIHEMYINPTEEWQTYIWMPNEPAPIGTYYLYPTFNNYNDDNQTANIDRVMVFEITAPTATSGQTVHGAVMWDEWFIYNTAKNTQNVTVTIDGEEYDLGAGPFTNGEVIDTIELDGSYYNYLNFSAECDGLLVINVTGERISYGYQCIIQEESPGHYTIRGGGENAYVNFYGSTAQVLSGVGNNITTSTNRVDKDAAVAFANETGISVSISTGTLTIRVTADLAWSATTSASDIVCSYTIDDLDSAMGYKVYQDGVVITTGTGPSFSFTATGGGEFEVVVWNTKTVSTLVVLTINMVGLGIMASVAFGWVLPFTRDIKNGRFRSADQMIKELIHGVIFIVVGCFMYVMLYNVAIG